MRENRQPIRALLILTALTVGIITLFMSLNVRGQWDFILTFRGTKVLTMALVGYAIAVSTVLFQTVSHNRILTPSIMGFDQLYILIQTSLVFTIGSAGLTALDPRLLFAFNVGAMVVFSTALYRWLFSGSSRSLHLLVLVGIVFGVLFRSLSSFMQRIIDPNEFVVLQDRLFANFNTIDSNLLGIAVATILIASFFGWRLMHVYDVLALGREASINLGLDHGRIVTVILMLVAVLVSVSTALVGPVTFFGLLVANLAYGIAGTHKHRFVLPVATLLAVICLIGGQLILERVFAFDTALSIVIEFVGGIVFLALLIRGVAR
ncbi:iron chelate uptake ABC transporter family permease subunit [Microvirga guangxiensis]|uniref:Iron complex transport system permease protein n=1 Tax=Microvirga guangxiensis TaxID=549386 RepID=A0A1G5GYA3_9HYPH|nr:iron chelate uptake ABC transporter family permease subunit [Microvirga guangxiensis]SCY56575.1 iron complex transport system permease protein [Microvirga guangxiensis]